MKQQTKGVLEIIIASFLFGIVPIIVKFGKDIGVYNLVFFRILIAAILIFLFMKFTNKKIAPFKYERWKLILFGALHGFIILGYFLAIRYLSISLAVLLLYSASIWMIVFGHFILKEKLTKTTIFALVISIIGVGLVLMPGNFDMKRSILGVVSALLAGIGFGLVYVLSKTFKKYDKVSLTFWQNVIALPFVLYFVFIDIPRFTGLDMFWLILTGALTAIAFVLVYTGLGKVKAQIAGIVVLLDIIFPILLAFLVFKEIPSLFSIIGGILIVVGAYIASAQ